MKAIVIGSGMSGLLMARVLSDFFEDVLILERDNLESDSRKGVPQQRHVHVVVVKGQQLIRKLYPTFWDEVEKHDAPSLELGVDVRVLTNGTYPPDVPTGITGYALSRVLLEKIMYQLTSKISNIRFMSGCRVNGLLHDNNTIVGVRWGENNDTIMGDLVVDASGRRSKSPEWFVDIGYTAPVETIVDAHIGYATRWYRVPPDYQFDKRGILIQPQRVGEKYIGAAGGKTEADNLLISLVGANKCYPPTDEQGFKDFARDLPDPVISRWIDNFEPISPIYGYRNAGNRLHHYEKLKAYPENYLIVGDAYCSLNPIYGQGITVAALEAELLHKLLSRRYPNKLQGFSRMFQRRLHVTIAMSWMMATGEDMRYPLVEGATPKLINRVQQKFIDSAFRYTNNKDIFIAILKVMNMVTSPLTLLHPKILLLLGWNIVYSALAKRFEPSSNSAGFSGTS